MSLDPQLLATATEAVLRAGELQMARFGSAVHVSKKGAIDLVTEVDLAVEEMFRKLVGGRFPEHDILAEELDDSGQRATSHYRWIFDPLDGTTNYAHGVPIFCTSLAIEYDGATVLAAVYDPNRRELFTAARGEGAFLNGEPMHTSAAAHLIDALLVTSFPYDVHQTAEQIVGLFGEFVRRTRAVRRLGSGALDLCYVAAGRFDGFWEYRLKPWDIAAGALLVQEAGGRTTSTAGEQFSVSGGNLVASNGYVHEEMLAIIRDFARGHS